MSEYLHKKEVTVLFHYFNKLGIDILIKPHTQYIQQKMAEINTQSDGNSEEEL